MMDIQEIIELVKKTKKFILNREMVSDVKEKGIADYVTQVDITVQNFLKEELFILAPDIQFLGEETGLQNMKADSFWILDPVDGTTNCDCLLSCFDANKKIIFIKHNGKIVFRAILRLTKGSFVAADERKTIEFVDVTVKSEPHENKAEELVLFLERYYQSGLSEQEIRKAVNLTAMLVKEKAEKLGARLVLSSSYKNVLENKNYVLTNFYMYISASKNGSQYLDSLGGAAGVSASGSYTCNTFLLEAEERREESL